MVPSSSSIPAERGRRSSAARSEAAERRVGRGTALVLLLLLLVLLLLLLALAVLLQRGRGRRHRRRGRATALSRRLLRVLPPAFRRQSCWSC